MTAGSCKQFFGLLNIYSVVSESDLSESYKMAVFFSHMDLTSIWAKYFMTLCTCRISRFETLRAAQLVKKFLASFRIRMCVTVIDTARHWPHF
jgi:hypothetical protein